MFRSLESNAFFDLSESDHVNILRFIRIVVMNNAQWRYLRDIAVHIAIDALFVIGDDAHMLPCLQRMQLCRWHWRSTWGSTLTVASVVVAVAVASVFAGVAAIGSVRVGVLAAKPTLMLVCVRVRVCMSVLWLVVFVVVVLVTVLAVVAVVAGGGSGGGTIIVIVVVVVVVAQRLIRSSALLSRHKALGTTIEVAMSDWHHVSAESTTDTVLAYVCVVVFRCIAVIAFVFPFFTGNAPLIIGPYVAVGIHVVDGVKECTNEW